MEVWELPTSIVVGGIKYDIRTDFRAILDILKTFNDPEFENDEKWIVALTILYIDFDEMPPQDYEEAIEKAIEFIDMGIKDDEKKKPHTMDWEQDGAVIIPSVNRVLGKEIRAMQYLHWWTFLGAYMEIGESLFSQILNVRMKKAKRKKLDDWERDFYKENKNLIDLDVKYTEEEQAERDRLNALLNGQKGV
ncbi:Gp15 family bacteriophage protein [Anaerostipes sp. Marseille-Q3525]|uniref:Gp15 family bacteriophage protein n=1 Tax=Anaerostipes sp. Marseille-Q3525 TaxID=2758418 RepID=UPI001BAD00AD|nr:Gp15 family bacteriophage protein [Anaerostipes sp. Marseille-Q3525]MBR9960797.1 hypothetical protein [Anaerostipes sp. Marseille-Q3525]